MKAGMIDILLVEDDEQDVVLMREAFKDGKVSNALNVVRDGAEALSYLHKEGGFEKATTPDLILLDLNLPKISGYQVLDEVKKDEELKQIPIVVLTTSDSEADVLKSYKLHANCYITKPVDFDQFIGVVRKIDEFWFAVVRLPPCV
jgi:CheY-like chemotaxis protein